ncbi:hypothetical protein TNCT_242311 [Trichonephila clavata]|uniref:Uncharacterized protein n=1 Tax=Trichonephila clavata TaxID=2740835 RepID=A0A8X6EYM6_TRICU|nr:hypothetical protein TNCT_242311 [Trichonephila clavata]
MRSECQIERSSVHGAMISRMVKSEGGAFWRIELKAYAGFRSHQGVEQVWRGLTGTVYDYKVIGQAAEGLSKKGISLHFHLKCGSKGLF